MDLSYILIGPVVTEKSYSAQDKAQYTFRVHSNATKADVKRAVKEFFGTQAKAVNIVSVKPKIRFVGRGRLVTKRRPAKRAIVTLDKGVKLDFSKLGSR